MANLPPHFKENDVDQLLAKFGQVVSTRILRDTHGQSKGVGFARMESREKCEQIIQVSQKNLFIKREGHYLSALESLLDILFHQQTCETYLCVDNTSLFCIFFKWSKGNSWKNWTHFFLF